MRLLAKLFLVCIGIAPSPIALAQPPSVSFSVLTTPPIAFNECMQRGSGTLQQMGATGTGQKTNSPGNGSVWGNLGDYVATVMCLTFKGVVVVLVAGTDSPT